jgi:hypothetical protein
VNITTYKILRLTFVLLFIYAVVTGILSFVFIGFIDFPCFVSYDEKNKCVEDEWTGDKDKTNYKIESFLTTYIAGYSGGGCHYEYTESNILNIKTSATSLRLERNGSSLTVNGKGLDVGNEYRVVKVLNWSPWVISQMKFENIGLVSDCNTPSTNQRIVIIGDYGTKISFIKGLSVLFISIGGFIFTQKKLKVLIVSQSPEVKSKASDVWFHPNRNATQHRMHLTLGSLGHFRAFSTLQVFSTPKHCPRPQSKSRITRQYNSKGHSSLKP